MPHRIIIFSILVLVLHSVVPIWAQEKHPKPISLYVESGIHHSARSVAFSDNGQLIATGSLDRTIKIWDIRSTRELMRAIVKSSV